MLPHAALLGLQSFESSCTCSDGFVKVLRPSSLQIEIQEHSGFADVHEV